MEAYNSITGTEELVSGRFTGDPKSRGTVRKRKRMQLRRSWGGHPVPEFGTEAEERFGRWLPLGLDGNH